MLGARVYHAQTFRTPGAAVAFRGARRVGGAGTAGMPSAGGGRCRRGGM